MHSEKMEELDALVESLGNVSLACKRMGVSRSLYYQWKSDQRQKGLKGIGSDGVADMRRHPQATSDGVRKLILELAMQFPEWGCDRIALYMALRKMPVSPTTVQKLLKKNGLGGKAERLAKVNRKKPGPGL
jgi:transposase-like protein